VWGGRCQARSNPSPEEVQSRSNPGTSQFGERRSPQCAEYRAICSRCESSQVLSAERSAHSATQRNECGAICMRCEALKYWAASQIGGQYRINRVESGAIRGRQRMSRVERGVIRDRREPQSAGASNSGHNLTARSQTTLSNKCGLLFLGSVCKHWSHTQ